MALFATHKDIKFGVGDIISLHLQSQEIGKRQVIVEGQVLGIKGEAENKSFLLRRIGVGNIGVEYIFPLFSPLILKVEVKKRAGEGIRRAKLYFLRGQPKAVIDKIVHRFSRKGKGQTLTKRKFKTKRKKAVSRKRSKK